MNRRIQDPWSANFRFERAFPFTERTPINLTRLSLSDMNKKKIYSYTLPAFPPTNYRMIYSSQFMWIHFVFNRCLITTIFYDLSESDREIGKRCERPWMPNARRQIQQNFIRCMQCCQFSPFVFKTHIVISILNSLIFKWLPMCD